MTPLVSSVSPMLQEIDDLFEHFDNDHEDIIQDLKVKNESSGRIVSDVQILGSTLKEYEVCIDMSSTRVPTLIRSLKDRVA